MSSLLYGRISQTRVETDPDAGLVFAEARTDGGVAPPGGSVGGKPAPKDTVAHWQDVLAALVPAEVLAIHALAMTLGTTTTGEGANTSTVITVPSEMILVFWFLVVAAFGLYLAGARSLSGQHLARAGVASLAFVLWTMIQPATAFDAFEWNPSTLMRTMIAIGGGLVLTVLASYLASVADRTPKT